MTELRNNLIDLLSQSFYKAEEKPAKYMEWLESEYTNGEWHINDPILLTPIPGDGGAQYISSGYNIEPQGTHGTFSIYVAFSGVNSSISLIEYYIAAGINAGYEYVLDEYGGFYAEGAEAFQDGDYFIIMQPPFISNNNFYSGFKIKIESNGLEWTITEV